MEVEDLLEDVMSQKMRQSLSPRWIELRQMTPPLIESRTQLVPGKSTKKNPSPGMVSQIITRPGWSGRAQTVWFITPAGAAYIQAWVGPTNLDESALVKVLSI